MSARKGMIGAVFIVFVIGGVISLTLREQPAEKIVYQDHIGDDPINVAITFSLPTDELTQVKESSVSREFYCGDLIQLEGELPQELLKEPKPVIVQFVEHRRDKDLVANSGTAIPDGHSSEFSLPVNVPQTPGIFDLQVVWGVGTSYIARASVKVRSKPKSDSSGGAQRK